MGPIWTQPLPPFIVGNRLSGPKAIIRKITKLLPKTKSLNPGLVIILWIVLPNFIVTPKINKETSKIIDCLITLASIILLSNLDIELKKLIHPSMINIKKNETIILFLLTIKSFTFSFSLSFCISFTFL